MQEDEAAAQAGRVEFFFGGFRRFFSDKNNRVGFWVKDLLDLLGTIHRISIFPTKKMGSEVTELGSLRFLDPG